MYIVGLALILVWLPFGVIFLVLDIVTCCKFGNKMQWGLGGIAIPQLIYAYCSSSNTIVIG